MCLLNCSNSLVCASNFCIAVSLTTLSALSVGTLVVVLFISYEFRSWKLASQQHHHHQMEQLFSSPSLWIPKLKTDFSFQISWSNFFTPDQQSIHSCSSFQSRAQTWFIKILWWSYMMKTGWWWFDDFMMLLHHRSGCSQIMILLLTFCSGVLMIYNDLVVL